MIDLEKAEKKLDKADSFLTKLKILFKKHWGILLVILGIGFIYWAWTLPDEEQPLENIEVVAQDTCTDLECQHEKNDLYKELYQEKK